MTLKAVWKAFWFTTPPAIPAEDYAPRLESLASSRVKPLTVITEEEDAPVGRKGDDYRKDLMS